MVKPVLKLTCETQMRTSLERSEEGSGVGSEESLITCVTGPRDEKAQARISVGSIGLAIVIERGRTI